MFPLALTASDAVIIGGVIVSVVGAVAAAVVSVIAALRGQAAKTQSGDNAARLDQLHESVRNIGERITSVALQTPTTPQVPAAGPFAGLVQTPPPSAADVAAEVVRLIRAQQASRPAAPAAPPIQP